MGRYGTREAELDDLLRRGVFVDLLKVVRNGLRASRPGYGLKEMEAFLDFERQAEVKDGGTSIVDLRAVDADRRAGAARPDRRLQPRGLHRDAAAARLAARAASRRPGRSRPAPPPEEPKPIPERKAERAALRAQLLDAGEELAAQLLDYHDRERKPVWWAFFDRIEMTPEELVEDAESIGQLELVGGPEPVKKSQAYALTYPRAGAQARAGAGRARPGDDATAPARSSSSTATSAGSCSSAGRRSRTCRCPSR